MRPTKKILRKAYPQKYWLKLICNFIYCLGLGECWYEDRVPSKLQKFYKIWAFVANVYMLSILLDEFLSFFRDDLMAKEKNDLIQLSFGHGFIYCKILVLYLRKDHIKVLLERLLEENRSAFKSSKLDKKSVRTAMMYSLATGSVVYLTLFATVIDAIITYYKEGIPIRTEVTYFPGRHDSGLLVNILRISIEIHQWYIVSVMVLIDSLSIFSLTFTGLKFIRVRLYFENLRGRFSNNPRSTPNAEEKQFWRDFVHGIKLHEDALWCARNVQRALGNIYSVLIVESIGILVICLVKLVSIERNFWLVVANLAFTTGMVVITGAYMMVAGEITYEASLISTAVFHCGWENMRMQAEHRALIVLAIQRSQVPVCMTAFGIITLSYSNFITVLRSSYSFFAVMF